MKSGRRRRALMAALVLGILGSPAIAQVSAGSRGLCNAVGSTHMEPLRDREGHNLSVQTFTCRIEGGPMNGAVLTGTNTYEWDKGVAVGLSGSMIARSGTGTYVAVFRDFGVTLTMADGRVTGWVAKTTGTYRLATGAATALNGKAFSTLAKPTGPGQFLLEIADEP